MLLSVPKALNDEILMDSGLKLFLDPSYKKEWNAAVTATIAALPLKCSPQEKKILAQLEVGDTVLMSYQVVADFEYQSDGLQFMKATDENPHIEEYTNGKGEWVKVYAMPKFTGISKIQWVGVYQDRNRKVIDGKQGTESEVKRWLAQFPIGKTDIYRFNNFFEYNGKEYWKCNLNQIFAKKVDGHLVAVGDRVICRPVEENVPREIASKIVRGTDDVKVRYRDRGRVLTGGKEKGIKKEQVISFQPQHLEKYEFDHKPYYLINQNLVQGTWQEA